MKTYNVERKLKNVVILSLASLLVACGPGFRAAEVGKGLAVLTNTDGSKSTSGGGRGANDVNEKYGHLSDQEMTDLMARELPKDPYQDPTPGEKSPIEQIAEQEQARKAAAEAEKQKTLAGPSGQPTEPSSPNIAEKAKESDPLTVKINNGTSFEEITLDMAKESINIVKPELAHYLEGFTFSVTEANEKKMKIEVLAVIKRGENKVIDRIVATGVVEASEKKNSLLETNRLAAPSAAMLVSAENLVAPAKNTSVGAICADEACETLYVLMRSQGRLNKEAKLFDLTLELKRHGQSYEIARSNASSKPLMIKTFHEAE